MAIVFDSEQYKQLVAEDDILTQVQADRVGVLAPLVRKLIEERTGAWDLASQDFYAAGDGKGVYRFDSQVVTSITEVTLFSFPDITVDSDSYEFDIDEQAIYRKPSYDYSPVSPDDGETWPEVSSGFSSYYHRTGKNIKFTVATGWADTSNFIAANDWMERWVILTSIKGLQRFTKQNDTKAKGLPTKEFEHELQNLFPYDRML